MSKAKDQKKSNVSLPQLKNMIEEISKDRNLPSSAVQTALREALLKGYERYRRSQHLDQMQFEEDHFDNFDVFLNLEEEAFQVVATKTIVEEVTDEDKEISIDDVKTSLQQESLEELSEEKLRELIGDSVILDVTPEREDFGRMAAIQAKQVLAQKLRDQQRKIIQEEFEQFEGTALMFRTAGCRSRATPKRTTTQ
jgi:transcription termination/antitermination protein NusA